MKRRAGGLRFAVAQQRLTDCCKPFRRFHLAEKTKGRYFSLDTCSGYWTHVRQARAPGSGGTLSPNLVIDMQPMLKQDPANPLSGLITDDTYEVLAQHRLLSEKGVRDYQIRQKFKEYRGMDVPAYDAIENLREEYPYLQFDTIRKIVYKLNCKR